MSKERNEMNNSDPEFDLFAKDVDDNLQEQLAKGTYKWTNKYTAVLGVLVIITGSVSGGIWYGSKHAGSATSNALAGFASRVRGAAAGGAFTGAAGATATDPAAAFAGAAGAQAGFAAGGGFGGGARITGKVSKVNGTTVTITLDAAPSTPLATGDAVTVRTAGAGGAAGGAPAAAGATGGTKPSTAGTNTGAAGAPTGAGPAGAPRAGGGGGGRFNNPAFVDCLAKNGVTFTAGTPPDRTDPKVAAAMQACISTLGAGAPGAGGAPAAGGGGGRAARPTPTATP